MSFSSAFPIQVLTAAQWGLLFPVPCPSGGALGALLGSIVPHVGRKISLILALSTMGIAMLALSLQSPEATQLVLDGVLVFDATSRFFSLLVLLSGFSMLAAGIGFDRDGRLRGEYSALMGFALVGMLLMVSTQNFMVLFLSLELMSLAVYVLVAMRRDRAQAAEAGLKYFLLGAVASSLYLYGASLLYGSTGSLDFAALQNLSGGLWAGKLPTLAGLGLILLTLGMLFKLGAVPFHVWIPDVYQGAMTPVTGFMITAVKAAAIGATLRIASHVWGMEGLGLSHGAMINVLSVIACATLLWGSVVGLRQNNLKRMLAYSSITHTGYLMLGYLAVGSGARAAASEAIAVYSLIYVLTNLGAFAVLTRITRTEQDDLEWNDLAGLAQQRPFLAFALSAFLVSMAGLPPSAGFYAKYLLFKSALDTGYVALTVAGAIASVVAAAYYLQPLLVIYGEKPRALSAHGSDGTRFVNGMVIVLALVFTFAWGIFPGMLRGLLP